MPRRHFLDDVAKAQAGRLPPGLADVKAGDDDGQVEFSFVGHPTLLKNGPVTVTALVTDLGAYPKSHEYMVFGGEDAPRDISDTLSNVRGISKKPVADMLDIVSATLCKEVQPGRDGASPMLQDDDEDEYAEEDEDEGDVYDSDHELFETHTSTRTQTFTFPSASSGRPTSSRAFRQRIRADLRHVKAAGFKVGHLGHLLNGSASYVVVSIRIAKLGISEEAMQAWQLEPTEYLTLLIQYLNGYKTNEQLSTLNNARIAPNLAMRVVIGKLLKPTLQETIHAFTNVRKGERANTIRLDLPMVDEADCRESSIRDSFISKPLQALLQERLIQILRYRGSGMSRCGAEVQ
jgi:ubiquitin-conjugating enzyme E2 Q